MIACSKAQNKYVTTYRNLLCGLLVLAEDRPVSCKKQTHFQIINVYYGKK